MKLLLFLIPFYFSLSWAAKTAAERTQCHNSPIVISIQGQKKNYENYKKFQADAQNYLSKAFTSENCKYKPQDIKLHLELREREGSDPQKRCESEIVGPNLPVKGNFMTLFRKVNMYYLRNPRCSTMTYPYVHSRQLQFAKAEAKKLTSSTIPKRKGLKIFHQEIGTEDLSETEGDFCPSCSYKTSPSVIDNVIKVAQTLKQKPNYTCEPQGYDKGMSKERLQQYVREGRMGELISRYSERSQGAIKRAYLSLVRPEMTNKARRLTNNFESFDHLSADQLREILYTKSNGKCYQYLKAALSGDYSILSQRKRQQENSRYNNNKKSEVPNRFNENLLSRECNIGSKKSPGDLAQSHSDWLAKSNDKLKHSNYAAGNSGPELETRGFINILDKKYGVVQNYIGVDGRVDEDLLPEGAVVIYHKDNSRNKQNNFSNYRNYYNGRDRNKLGDVAIKSSKGYLREYFDDTPYSASLKRVVVEVYIKPTED